MSLEEFGRVLLVIAAVLAVTGVLLFLIGKGFGLTKLPGDILIKRDGWRIFFPIATSILISIILTVVVNVIFWLLRR